ncbi:14901_t:CDS:2 [Cetraspora pellucida]|uniref:14901_t:CDS:1 n=1 Tax=Cetraspora pellucida TaxID=1433469 RepID=A0A9N9HD98_9GLOM|nr:14901_t:CDS:2 [Cetraspora pellucida]
MSCYVDTIVKINQVCQTNKQESKLTSVCVIGVYPIKSEDCEMKMFIFIPISKYERDPNTQFVFKKNKYYSIGRKVVLGSYNGNLKLKMTVMSSTHLLIKRDSSLNKCPLKVSLVGNLSSISDSFLSKYAKVDDTDLNHIDSDYVKDKIIMKCNEKYVKSNESGENISSGSKKKRHSYKKTNNKDINYPIVHNMKKHTKMLKTVNNSKDRNE